VGAFFSALAPSSAALVSGDLHPGDDSAPAVLKKSGRVPASSAAKYLTQQTNQIPIFYKSKGFTYVCVHFGVHVHA